MSRLSHLVDIFDQLNRLKLKVQGKGTTIIDFIDALNAFVQKLENWTRKAEKENFAMFEALSTATCDDMDDALSSEILVPLTSLRKEFLRYFPEILESDLKLMRKLFAVPVEVRDDQQDEFTDLKNDSTCRHMFDTLSVCEFWAQRCALLTRESLKNASPSCYHLVVHIYANQGFVQSLIGINALNGIYANQGLMQMKNWTRNRLDKENRLRCALSSTYSEIETLVH